MGRMDNLRWDVRCSICEKMSLLHSQQHNQSVWLGLGANYKICGSKSQVIQYQRGKIIEYLEQGACKVLRFTENFKHLFKSFLFLSCTLTLCPSAVISGDENSNKPILFPSSYQLGASNAIKIVSFYRGKGMVALGKFNKSPPVLFAERFELVVTSVMWHHAACVEDTKENSCYSSPREATVSAKDIFSVSIFFLFVSSREALSSSNICRNS